MLPYGLDAFFLINFVKYFHYSCALEALGLDISALSLNVTVESVDLVSAD